MLIEQISKDGALVRGPSYPVFSIKPLSIFNMYTLKQALVEDTLIQNIKRHSSIEIERGVIPESLSVDETVAEDSNAYPVTVKLRHLSGTKPLSTEINGALINELGRSNLAEDDTQDVLRKSKEQGDRLEIVKAKYVIGCDGGQSWTRDQIGATMEGERTNFVYGIMDIIPITDFRKY